jgi:hypothetical protein
MGQPLNSLVERDFIRFGFFLRRDWFFCGLQISVLSKVPAKIAVYIEPNHSNHKQITSQVNKPSETAQCHFRGAFALIRVSPSILGDQDLSGTVRNGALKVFDHVQNTGIVTPV